MMKTVRAYLRPLEDVRWSRISIVSYFQSFVQLTCTSRSALCTWLLSNLTPDRRSCAAHSNGSAGERAEGRGLHLHRDAPR